MEHGLADSLQTLLTVPSPHLDLTVTDGQGDNLAQLAVESEAGERQRCVELLCRDCRSVITQLHRLQVSYYLSAKTAVQVLYISAETAGQLLLICKTAGQVILFCECRVCSDLFIPE